MQQNELNYKLTLSSSRFSLDVSPVQVTTRYKLIAKGAAVSTAAVEILLDITWEHPCRTAAFPDLGVDNI